MDILNLPRDCHFCKRTVSSRTELGIATDDYTICRGCHDAINSVALRLSPVAKGKGKSEVKGLLDFGLRPGGLADFRFAVTIDDQTIAWCKTKKHSELLAWALAMQEQLEEQKNQRFLELQSDFLKRLGRDE